MKKRNDFFVLAVVLILCSNASAVKFDVNSIAEITTDPNSQVYGWQGTFAIAKPGGVGSELAVWIDGRDPCGIPAVYGIELSGPPYNEFVIDPCATGCSKIAASGTKVVYNIDLLSGEQFLRVAEIGEPNNILKRVDVAVHKWLGSFDISGSIITYSSNDPNTWVETVYALDISDLNDIEEYAIKTLPVGESLSGLAIDVNHIVWSVRFADLPYVQIVDITDLNEPNIVKADLPEQTSFEDIDISEKWLVAHGWYNWQTQIFAVHNFPEVNNWKILTLWKEGEGGDYYVSGPRLDGHIAVWLTTTRMPSLQGSSTLLNPDTEWLIKSSYLMGNGNYTLSTLRRSTAEKMAAEVLGKRVVWSEQTTKTSLFKGSLLLECGDWGYVYGDLNKDCVVNFKDFAIFAENWLKCTTPDGEDCGFGPL